MQTAENFASSLFINDSHITNTVDSYYVIGYGEDTIMEVEEEFNKDGSFDKCTDLTILNGGDETVPVISANIGGMANPDKTYYIKDTHTGMVKNSDVINLVKSIINGNPNTYESSIQKNCPESITKKGWLKDSEIKIKLKIECPVNLTMIDENNDVWAFVSPDIVYNEKPEEGSFYLFGKDNDSKMAYMDDNNYNVQLLGTDEGTMKYTVSVYDSGEEFLRVVFENVPITENTVINTNTDYANGIVLNVDEEGDGIVDYQIHPNSVMDQSDLVQEENGLDFSKISAITSDKEIGMQINGNDVKITKAVLADGTCNFYTSKDVELENENNSIARVYQNGMLKETAYDTCYDEIKGILEEYFANKENVLPCGADSYGNTDGFYNITEPLTDIVTDNNIVMSTQDIVSTDDCVVYSRQGDVSVYTSNMDFDGVIYAPNGTVTIYGSTINIHGTIIAEKIVINGQTVLFD